MAFDKTNKAIVYVEDGLFNKEGVERLQNDNNKPIIVVKANIDGVEKEISLWFSKDKETGQYKLTQNGNKMLTGKVSDPYVGKGFTDRSATPKPEFTEPETSDLPF